MAVLKTEIVISKRTVLNDRLKVAVSAEGCYCGPLIAKLMEASICLHAPTRGFMCACGCFGAFCARAREVHVTDVVFCENACKGGTLVDPSFRLSSAYLRVQGGMSGLN